MRDGRGWALAAVTTAAITVTVSLNGARLLAQSGTGAQSPKKQAQVRSSDRLIADLIGEAELRSATFKALLATLASTNGIVHVESGRWACRFREVSRAPAAARCRRRRSIGA
jgi:hypothetical protein